MADKEIYLYFVYSDYWENRRKFIIGEYTFPGAENHSRPFNLKTPPEGKINALKCPCGGNSWSENGRYMHEYECDCCGQFVEVLPFEPRDNGGKK
ncbi:hypothetical protein [Morganella phage Mecenats66]|nr:hypothetical protein [Morganella phage Mecenats66]